ncbi:MAG: ArsR/SmtB family transcription factor [Phycisphaerales bacterium]|jgi:SAM-dependent methyltransferase
MPRASAPGEGADRSAELLGRLAAMGDLARWRVLALLEREELGVGEVARTLQVPQSTASRHLKALLEGGWVARRSEGPSGLYRLAGPAMPEEARLLWELAKPALGRHPESAQDLARLASVLADRKMDSRSFFGRLGGEWSEVRRDLFGDRVTALALLDLLDPQWSVADLGCGTGEASQLLAPCVRKVIAIDRERSMLEAARKRLGACDNVDFRQGALESLPLKDGEADAAVIMLVLHHVPDPSAVLREAVRGVRSGGGVLVVDLVPHDRRAYAASMGHLHMGFSRGELEQMARSAGVQLARHRELPPEPKTAGPGLFAALFRAAPRKGR